ncbi:platelet basic protein [Diceros bicornis minor]|uniref:platelet basic protein n=1 Tax=Diceros bicornis minor TaxID=77932 RepID=UPI0026EAD967|nr:platelet basic protein [Diceros bicornis minor]
MSLRPKATSSCSSASPLWVLRVLLPLSLLLTALVPSIAIRELTLSALATSVDRELYVELRCLCLQTTSGVHPSKIQSLKVMRAGPHCHKVEVIATLLNGDEICLDPEDLRLRKIIQKILKSD